MAITNIWVIKRIPMTKVKVTTVRETSRLPSFSNNGSYDFRKTEQIRTQTRSKFLPVLNIWQCKEAEGALPNSDRIAAVINTYWKTKFTALLSAVSMGRGPPSSEVGEQYVENLFSAEKKSHWRGQTQADAKAALTPTAGSTLIPHWQW